MTATTSARNTSRRDGVQISLPAAASAVLAGTIVVINSAGYAEAGTTATGKVAAGVAEESVDNSAGSVGDLNVPVRRGVFAFFNSASTDEIALTDYDADCYIVDNQTVAKTSGTNTRSVAGKVRGLADNGQVWVEF